MSFGFKSLTDNNALQVDENTPVMAQVATGVLNFGTYTNGTFTGTVTYTGNYPIIALRAQKSGNIAAGVISTSRSGNNWTFTVAMNNIVSGSTVYTCTYYIFDSPISLPSWGMAVWDSASKLTFATAERPLRMSGNDGSAWNGVSDDEWIIQSGKNYAVIMLSGYQYREQEHESDPSSSPGGIPTYWWTYQRMIPLSYVIPGGFGLTLQNDGGGDGFAPDPGSESNGNSLILAVEID